VHPLPQRKATLTLDEKDRALCTQTDPEIFYPEQGQTNKDAKRICAQCPIRARCLEVALANGERFGIWGGLSDKDCRQILAARRKAEREGVAA
jgi:WhiB family redox-sensing transcriptional regulator